MEVNEYYCTKLSVKLLIILLQRTDCGIKIWRTL
jgi:hypothetical protein